jgi:hypothetical protein
MATGLRRERNAYRPGQKVPISGVYTVVHVAHRSDHQVIAIRGEELPFCRACGANVSFYPAQPVTYMTQDFDLAGLSLQILKTRAKTAKRGAL